MPAPETAADIQSMVRAFQSARVLLTALELDVFTVLSGTPSPSAAVAEAIGADPRATDRLLNALVAIGLLEKEAGVFRNTPVADRFLSSTSPAYLSGLHHMNHLWDTWSLLTDAVRAGTRVEQRAPRSDEKREGDFIEAMHARARAEADSLAAELDLSGVRRVLDVGGGSGVYSMAFVRAREGLTATVLDLPSVVERTRRYVEKEGLAGRFDYIPGRFLEVDFGAGYDMVFISAILHMLNPKENRQLLARASAALSPGGQLVIAEFLMEENRVEPAHGALFALNMLVATRAGDTYTEHEIREWMEECAIGDIRRINRAPNITGLAAPLLAGRKR